MRRIAFLLVSILLVFPLYACHQTEDQTAVTLQEGIPEDAPLPAPEIPSQFHTDLQAHTNGITFDIQAEITAPETKELSIYRVHAADFEQEVIDYLWDALIGDQPMYEARSTHTKQENEALRLSYQSMLKESTDAYESERLQSMIDRLTAEYESAPETIPETIATSALEKIDIEVGDTVVGYYEEMEAYEKSDTSGMQLYVRNSNSLEAPYIDPAYRDMLVSVDTNAVLQYIGKSGRLDGKHKLINEAYLPEAQNLKISANEALAAAQSFLDGLNAVLPDARIAINELFFTQMDGASTYTVTCVREIAGVPCAFNEGESGYGNQPVFPWEYERLIMQVDDTGIHYFAWLAPIAIDRVEAPSVELLPFSEIEAIFSKYMLQRYDTPNAQFNPCRYYVDQVSLEMHRVVIANEIGQGMLVPVWSFYGGAMAQDADGYEYNVNYSIGGALHPPLLTINAVNGSIIY